MITKLKRKTLESFAVVVSLLFIFGCIASSLQTAETLEPKQVAFGAGYMNVENAENSDAESIDLLDLSFRYGIAKGFDMGLAHTFDLSSESQSTGLSTFWWDIKGQLSNLQNKIGNLSFSLGLIKGYTYDPEVHVSTIPVILSVPVSENITPTFQYRISFFSDSFIPTNFESPRHAFYLGMEYSFFKMSTESWNPRIGFAVGTFNSLTGSESADRGITLNMGITVESPVSY